MNRPALAGLVLGAALALYLLPWYAGVGLLTGLIVLGLLAGPTWLSGGPTPTQKVAVLEGADVEVISADAVDSEDAWSGASPEVRASQTSLLPDNLSYHFVLDLIVTPAEQPEAKITWWSPAEIELGLSGQPTNDGAPLVLHRMVWQGESFAADDGDKYVGPLRLRFAVAAAMPRMEVQLDFHGLRMGHIELKPAPQRKPPKAALTAKGGFHIPPPSGLIPPTDPRTGLPQRGAAPQPEPAIEVSPRSATTQSFGTDPDITFDLLGSDTAERETGVRVPSGVRRRMHQSMTGPTYRFPSEITLDVYGTVREKFRVPPVDGLDAESFRPIGRHEQPHRFGRNVLPPNGIPDPEPEVLDKLLHATYVYRVRVQVPETSDLGYLAHAMTTASSLGRAIDGVIRDVQTQRVFTADALRNILKSSDFDISQHILVHSLKEPDGQPGLWLHTHGLTKFGRPDIEMRTVPSDYRDIASHGLLTIADYLSQGAVVKPGETLQLGTSYLTFTLASGSTGDEEFPNGLVRVTDFDPEESVPAVGVVRWLSGAMA